MKPYPLIVLKVGIETNTPLLMLAAGVEMGHGAVHRDAATSFAPEVLMACDARARHTSTRFPMDVDMHHPGYVRWMALWVPRLMGHMAPDAPLETRNTDDGGTNGTH